MTWYLEGSEQDNGFRPTGTWKYKSNHPFYNDPKFNIPNKDRFDQYFGYNYYENKVGIKFNKTLESLLYEWDDAVLDQYALDNSIDLFRVKPVPYFFCKKDFNRIFYSDYKSRDPGFLCYKETIAPPELGCSTSVGNPCSVTTGNKTLSETDWRSENSPLFINRFYNSLSKDETNKAAGWTSNYEMSLQIVQVQGTNTNTLSESFIEPNTTVVLKRSDGKFITVEKQDAINTVEQNSKIFVKNESLEIEKINVSTWQVRNVKTGTVETYENFNSSEDLDLKLTRIDYMNGQFVNLTYQNNQLYRVIDHYGQALTYNFIGNQLRSISLPSGKQITYLKNNNELQVTRPGYGTKTYIYDESNYAPNPSGLITGIIDEKGRRYATYSYDQLNRGVSTEHAGNSQKYTLSFNEGYTEVITPNGDNRRYNLEVVSEQTRVREQTIGERLISNEYDASGNLISLTESGITTKYDYDPLRNLEIKQVIGFGTSDSTITITEWNDNLPVKAKVTEGSANIDGSLKQALRVTTYTHDERGNILTKTVTDPINNHSKVWQYSYNDYGQKTSETIPSGLEQLWEYNQSNGNLLSITDTQGLITTYSNHSNDGKPKTIIAPSGQITTLEYDAAGRILSQIATISTPKLNSLARSKNNFIEFQNWWRKLFRMKLLPNPIKYDITSQPAQNMITRYNYDMVGQLIDTTLTDGEVISYAYDDAHRLTSTTDSLGNRITYTLNGAGDIIQTDSYDPQGVLAQSSKQSFDTLGRLSQDQGNNGQQTNYDYDPLDNLTQTQDALNRTNTKSYDVLDRTITDADTLGNKVTYTYDALGQLTAVTDSRGNTTSYDINAFGETLQINSPDTGITSFDFNDAGQLMRQTDASGRVQAYQYDEQGKLITINDAQAQLISSYSYDDLGRIVLLTSPSSSTNYTYDSAGRVIEKSQTLDGRNQINRYHYTAGGKLDEVRLPSGKLIVYAYDKGILTGITVKHDNPANNDTTQVVDTLTYNLNGINSFNWSQTNKPVSYDYDLDSRLIQINDPALSRSYSYDTGNRITSILDATANIDYNYEHDQVDRLLKQDLGAISLGYAYDTNSNRTQNKVSKDNTVDINNISYESDSNHIVGVSYDGSGRIVNDGTRSYTYNTAGNIERIQNGSTGIYNVYNPLGQRIQKNSGNAKTYYVYDEQGLLTGEYDANNNPIREYIYLAGQPIALLSSQLNSKVLQIHSDHLGTPRAVTDKDNAVLWRMEGDQFGNVSPQISTIKMPLRHAGQYHDSETGLFYNWYRFYDPKSGRYVTSDPIGLQGGTNTYGYVGGSPLHYIDPTGELFFIPAIPAAVGALGALTAGIVCYATNCGQAAVDAVSNIGTWEPSFPGMTAGVAPYPNTISHAREHEILRMNGFEPCDELKQTIDDLKTTIAWRKSDLNPAEKGTKEYVNHQKRIKILNNQKDKLQRRYNQYCQDLCIGDGLSVDGDK